MNKYTHHIGIDVSKHTINACVLKQDTKVFETCVANNPKGFKAFEKQLKSHGIAPGKALLCLEHTGIYNHNPLLWITQNAYSAWLENPLAIKRSMGLQRGKNDQVDAHRIALYAFRFQSQCRLWQAPRKALQELQLLMATRKRLLQSHKQLQAPLKETQTLFTPKQQKKHASYTAATLQNIKKDLARVDKDLKELIQQDEHLAHLTQLIASVQGIGLTTAITLLITTNEFKTLQKAPQLACYAGVVPFAYQSGTSVRGQYKVSHLANKSLKTLLHMAALSAIQHSIDLAAYYQRKVAAGKAKMLVINAVRNKLLQRICAVVRDNRLYEKTYTRTLA